MLQITEHPSAIRKAVAERIKLLIENWTANTLAIGKELATGRETFPPNPKRPHERPGFEKWAMRATGLSRGHVRTLFVIHEKFGARSGGHRLAGTVMKLLISRDVPESARIEVADRAARGEHIGRSEAKKIADKHRLPGPKAANEQAKEEGHPVLASDGYIYFGTDPAKAKQGADRRSMVFGVRDALKHLGTIELTGRQFLDYAFPHQLWTAEEAPIIKKALRWLSDLSEAWDARK